LDTSELLKELRIDRDGRPPRRRGRWLVVAAIVLVLAGVGGWLAYARLAPPTVRTATARSVAAETPGSVLDASGYVTARRQATVSAKITGKVTEVRIEEGMRVEAGDVLARLDDTEARAQLALARAQLSVASSQEGEIRALLQQAESDYTRAQELFNRQLVSAQAIDAARAQRDTLRARLIANTEQVRAARESVSVASVQLDNTIIRAPFTGTVLRKDAEVGEVVAPSVGGGLTRGAVVTMADLSTLEVEVDVNEAYIARIASGRPARITLDAYPDTTFRGEVRQVVPTADRQRATVQVKVSILDHDPRILPEMGAKVDFLEPPKPAASGGAAAQPAIRVPSAAVRSDASGSYVWLVRDGRLTKRPVTTGPVSGGFLEVRSGLSGGEQLLVGGVEKPEEGMKVKVE